MTSLAGFGAETYRQGVVSGSPRRSPKPPPPPKKPSPSAAFDPSKPLLDLDAPATERRHKASKRRPEPILPNLDLPSRKRKSEGLGLGPVAMSDPLQDATTLVSTPNPLAVEQSDAPLAGGTEVAAPAIPTATPKPTSIVPGNPSAPRSNVPFIAMSSLAVLAWASAAVLGSLSEPPRFPEVAAAPAATPPKPATPKPEPAAEAEPEAPAADAEPEPTASSWTVEAPTPPRALLVVGETAVVSLEDKVVGYRDGQQAWAFDGAHQAVFAIDEQVVVVQTSALVGLSATDGSPAFTADVPKRGKTDPEVVAADADTSQVLLALADARFLLLTPSGCVEPADGEIDDAIACFRTVGRLAGEYLEPNTKVALGPDGHRFLAEEDALRGFDPDMRTIFEASTHADVRSIDGVAGGRLALQFGQETALLDVERCRSRSEARLRTKDTQAPAGCVLWRYGYALDPVAPAVVGTDGLAMNERGKLQLVTEGDDAWKLPLGAFGPVATADDVVFTLAVKGDGLVVAEVDARRATVRARHALPFNTPPEARAEARLQARGRTIAASVGTQLAVMKL